MKENISYHMSGVRYRVRNFTFLLSYSQIVRTINASTTTGLRASLFEETSLTHKLTFAVNFINSSGLAKLMRTEGNTKRQKCNTYITKLHKALIAKEREDKKLVQKQTY